MRVAFISLYEAYPPTSGAASVTFNCARLTPCTTLLVQISSKDSVEDIAGRTIVSLRQQTSSRLGKLRSMPQIISRIRKSVVRFAPDCIVIEGASWAVYLAILVWVLKKAMPVAKLIYHAHNVEYILRQERSGSALANITGIAEKFLVTKCHRSFAVSEDDRQRFLSLYDVLPSLLPNGVDCGGNNSTQIEIEAIRQKYGITADSILFMGLYGYPPNAEAVRFLIEQVMPLLLIHRPNLQLVVTGGGPPDPPEWLISTGVIPRRDLDTVLRACRIGVAPIFKGSGTRLKILEYMAAELPVVSTRKGAEGLDLKPERHLLYAETALEFQDAILRLLTDGSLSKSISLEAATLVRAKFNWIPLLRQFAAELETL
jgi:polysaccharide biosynthesis protein PslH